MSASMRAAMGEVPEHIPVQRVDELWLFPPRQIGDRESGLVVLSVVPEGGEADGQRQVFTLRYEGVPGRAPERLSWLEEQGSAPVERIPHIINGVLRRLGETDEPRRETIRGDAERWESLLSSLEDVELDQAYQE